jgi:hypothetical protein
MTAELGLTAKENYWQVVSWWEMPYGKVPRGMWIGHAASADDRIWWENPRPPENPDEILNWGKPVDDQVWTREPMPWFWEDDYLRRMAVEKFSTGKTEKQRIANADYYWYKNVDNLTDEQYEYQEREWDRRLNGKYIMIGGEFVHLTGKFYMFLQWAWLVDTWPEYLERQLLIHYAWQAMCDDLLCRGGVFPKGRRGGLTSIFSFEGIEETTRTKGGHFGIQAAGEKGAEKLFNDKVKPAWKKFPPFFRPITSSGDNPKGEIIMDVESRRGRTQHTAVSHEGLEGWIRFAPNGTDGVDPFDGDKLTRFVRDEGGKADRVDILDNWDLVSPTLIGRIVRGMAAWPSSVEDVQGKHRDKFRKLCDDSMPGLRKSTGSGTTTSYMWTFFLPIYCSHPEYWFVGKFGESIVHKPTPEQREWLLANRAQNDGERRILAEIYDLGGAFEYEQRQRATKNNDPGYIRKNPFHLEECFIAANPDCYFNLDHLNSLKQQLMEPELDGDGNLTNALRRLTVAGRLEWTDGPLSDVVFVEDSRGAFIWNRAYLPGAERAEKLGIFANRVNRVTVAGKTTVTNMTGSAIKIGFDPQKQDSDESTGHKSGLSKAAGHAFIPYNAAVESQPWDETVPGFAKEYISHAFIFEYLLLPRDSTTTHEDMLKACILLNAKFHSEKQVFTAIKYFKAMGANGLLLRDVELNGVNRQSGNVVAGQQASEITEQQANEKIRDFVEYHPYADRFPFLRTIEQLIKYDKRNVSRLDLKVSKGFTLMAAMPGAVMPHKMKQKPEHTVPEKPDKGKWVARHAQLSKGYSL